MGASRPDRRTTTPTDPSTGNQTITINLALVSTPVDAPDAAKPVPGLAAGALLCLRGLIGLAALNAKSYATAENALT